jgi:hypothetical protein
VLLRDLARMTALSRQQVPRLVRLYRTDVSLSHRHGPALHHLLPPNSTLTYNTNRINVINIILNVFQWRAQWGHHVQS